MNRLPKIVLFFFLFFFVICNQQQNGRSNEATEQTEGIIPVTVMKAAAREFTIWSSYYGTIQPRLEARLTSGSGGRVEAIYVEEGSKVDEGQSLARIDADEIVYAYRSARLNNKIALQNYERAKIHVQNGTISELAVEQARLQWLTARSQFLQAARQRKDALCITPISGVVTIRFIQMQQDVAPNAPTFTVAKTDTVKVTIGIHEEDITRIQKGAAAQVSLGTQAQQIWDGRLVSIAQDINPQQRTYEAEIVVGNSQGLLQPGLTARVLLTLQSFSDRVVVPNNAIVTEGDMHYVVTVSDSTAHRVPVTLGPADSTHTVLLDGITAGATIVVKGAHFVDDGTTVTIVGRSDAP